MEDETERVKKSIDFLLVVKTDAMNSGKEAEVALKAGVGELTFLLDCITSWNLIFPTSIFMYNLCRIQASF